MKPRIVHIVVDDKFIDGAISLFETDDRVDNTYVIIGESKSNLFLKYSYINYIDKTKALDYINKFDAVIIHSLPAIPIELISRINHNVLVIWFAWGYDLYEAPCNIVPIKLYGPETRKIIAYDWLKINVQWRYQYKRFYIKAFLKSALKRIDYFSGVFPYEHDLVKKYHPYFRALPLDFYYGAPKFFIPEIPSNEIKQEKKNIFIGNSGDPSGNHLDVLKKLETSQIDKNASLVIPLSYCGTSRYINKIIERANKIAPGRVVPLLNYMPLEEYMAIISNCKVAIFAHERQQASDNIFMQLLFGAKVYMSENSAAYSYLKSIGLKVYSLQGDLGQINEKLNDEDVLLNRRILSERYSSTKLVERIKVINTKIIDTL